MEFCVTHRTKQLKALCNHLSCLKEKHMFSASMFGSRSLHPESHWICEYAFKNKVLRSCLPSCCHADHPELPALGCDHFLLITPSKIGRDESKNEPVEKAPAECSSSPVEKCSKDQGCVVRFRPGTSKSGMDGREKWLVPLRERNAPVSTHVQEIWAS